MVETQEEPETKNEVEPPPLISTDTPADLLVSFVYTFISFLKLIQKIILHVFILKLVKGLSETNPKAAELEESNALALAIIPSGMLTVNLGRKEFYCGSN